ncbi:hypothetical protein [Limnothrix redekei]|uniref:Uncharacterized protein n=1 Tax=Limnothrix redekei LRLZ20PSL1 TaxID=3112953 RepID=A0ABW7C956_9CYAN
MEQRGRSRPCAELGTLAARFCSQDASGGRVNSVAAATIATVGTVETLETLETLETVPIALGQARIGEIQIAGIREVCGMCGIC